MERGSRAVFFVCVAQILTGGKGEYELTFRENIVKTLPEGSRSMRRLAGAVLYKLSNKKKKNEMPNEF